MHVLYYGLHKHRSEHLLFDVQCFVSYLICSFSYVHKCYYVVKLYDGMCIFRNVLCIFYDVMRLLYHVMGR